MAWSNAKQVQQLAWEYQVLCGAGAEVPCRVSSLYKKKWSRASWHYPLCKYFNFSFRTVCFKCKVGQEVPATTEKEQAPAKKPLRLVPHTSPNLGSNWGTNLQTRRIQRSRPTRRKPIKKSKLQQSRGRYPRASAQRPEGCVEELKDASVSTHSGETKAIEEGEVPGGSGC
eukprot:5928881-Amphidinium_carterae.1